MTTNMICPVCQGQMELSSDGLFYVCPLCGYKEEVPGAADPADAGGAEGTALPAAPSPDIVFGATVTGTYGEGPKQAEEASEGEDILEKSDEPIEEEVKKPERKKTDWQKVFNVVKRAAIALLACIVLAAVVYGVIRIKHRGEIRPKMSAEDVLGMDYQVAEAELRDLGFTDVKILEKLDLGRGDEDRFRAVSQISIDGQISFNKRSWFKKDAPVVITYHDLDPAKKDDIQIPEDSKAYEKQNYTVVLAKVQAAGFTNIYLQPMYDVSFLSKTDEGEVEKVTIDGDQDFKAGDWVSGQSVITIYYHEKKSKGSEGDTPISDEETRLSFSAKDLKGEDRETVVRLLKEQGFAKIDMLPLNDLKKAGKKENTVESVLINGEDSFKKGAVFPINSEITVSYHSVKTE